MAARPPRLLPPRPSVGKQVVLVGTLDTKGREFAYVRDRLRELGLETTVVDIGILGEPLGIEPDIDHS